MWFHFKTLSKEEKLERRHLLDLYGRVAQLSALLPLLLLNLYFLSLWARATWKRSRTSFGRGNGNGNGNGNSSSTSNNNNNNAGLYHGRDDLIPGSPYLKSERAAAGWAWTRGKLPDTRTAFRRAMWWAGGTVEGAAARWVVGVQGVSRGACVGAGVWMAWLLVLSFVQTKGDYLHLTKRLGMVGASQLPLQYLLSLKTPYSPLQLLTRAWSWERLNGLHQLLGRIVTVLFYAHTALYLNFFARSAVLGKRLGETDVVLGLVGIAAFTLVGTTALAWVRKRRYGVFYSLHVGLATLVLPVLFFHVRHLRLYVCETLGIYIVHFILRFVSERMVSASVALVPGTDDLLEISIPLSSFSPSKGKGVWTTWQPGQHVYLSLHRSALFTAPLRNKNPFTIASLPAEDKKLLLIARVMDGNTAALAREIQMLDNGSRSSLSSSGAAAGSLSSSSHQKPLPLPLTIEGPYGLGTHSLELLRYTRVLFLAGGVGATFVMPLYRTLLSDLSPSAGSQRRQRVKLVWAVKKLAETGWALSSPTTSSDGSGREGVETQALKERMSVFVTRRVDDALRGSSFDDEEGVMKRSGLREQDTGDDDDDEEGVEMERLLPAESGSNLLTSNRGLDGENQGRQNDSMVRYGRPDIGALIDQTFAGTSEYDKVAVIVCGPKGMARQARNEVGRWIVKRDVWFWSEEFGL